MKIVIHPTTKKVQIAILVVSVIAIFAITFHSELFPLHTASTPTASPDMQAAVDAVSAFYTLDYSASRERWRPGDEPIVYRFREKRDIEHKKRRGMRRPWCPWADLFRTTPFLTFR